MNDPAKVRTPPIARSFRQQSPAGLVCAIAILLISVALRLDASRDDLWVDELHTAWVIDGSWSELTARAAIGNQSPLYFAIAKLVTTVAGTNEFTLRFISLLSGVGLVCTAYWFTWRQTRDALAAIISLLALGLDPTCIFYSSEARPYALMQLVLAWHLICTASQRKGAALVLARMILASLAIHLQFTSLLYLAPLYAALFARVWIQKAGDRKAAIVSFVIECLGIILLTAPLAPQVLAIAQRGKMWESFIPDPTLKRLWNLFPWIPFLIGVSSLFVAAKQSPSSRNAIAVLVWSAIAPITLALVLHRLDVAPLFFRRYLLACAWPILIAPGLCIASAQNRLKWSLGTFIIVAIIAVDCWNAPAHWQTGRLAALHHERWSDAVAKIAEIDPHGKTPLFIGSGLIESRELKTNPSALLRNYCRLPVATIYRTPHVIETIEPISSLIPATPPQEWVQQVDQHGGGIWLIRIHLENSEKWDRFFAAFKRAIEAQEPSFAWRLEKHAVSGITIFELRRMGGPAP